MIRDAVFSPDGVFRYRLTRRWNDALPRLAMVLLNPSRAGRELDDPTTRRGIGFARRLGFGGLELVNLFAYVATDPADLRSGGWQVGPENDRHIEEVCRSAGLVVCGWGNHAAGLARTAEVLRLMRAWGVVPYALKLTSGGHPAHPSRLAYGGALVAL